MSGPPDHGKARCRPPILVEQRLVGMSSGRLPPVCADQQEVLEKVSEPEMVHMSRTKPGRGLA
jgi:hypothetical protein